MLSEIGSEFWSPAPPSPAESTDGDVFLLSGRTALQWILEDLRERREVTRALLPSYCCESMILPFLQAGLDVAFYEVHRDTLVYPYGNDADVILLLDFFGYAIPQNAEIARVEKKNGKVVIYDATHKLDGNPAVEAWADYSFCSFRKWFYCNYARAVRHGGDFVSPPPCLRFEAYERLRDEAAKEKEAYMAGRTNNKESFLQKFRAAEEMLESTRTLYAGHPAFPDLCGPIAARRENAAYLIRELREVPELLLWRDTLHPEDTPLFVPVLMEPGIRGELRAALTREGIYCPIHWPASSYHGHCNELYSMELSLVCDQRYGRSDMERTVRVIKDYFHH